MQKNQASKGNTSSNIENNRQQPLSNSSWSVLISLLIVLIAILHYATSVHLHHLHDLYRVLFYIPIILAAYKFQLKGGLFSALGIIAIYYPHVAFQWGGDFLSNSSRFLQMLMYLVIGAVAGSLAQRENNERRRYQQVATELQESYKQLKIQSEKLSEIEEQLLQSERLSVLGELAASLAHEVRNPLGSIWGVVEILQDKFKNKGRDLEFMEILVTEVKRLNDVVVNYLNLARKTRLNLKTHNLEEIINSVTYLMHHKAQKMIIKLKIDFSDQPVFIKTDENQLRQVLINLVLNSMAAISKNGSITIQVRLISPKLPSGKEPEVHLSVIDTGHGMEPDVIQQIYKPFFTTKKTGTGLGLSIVKRIIDQNQWKMLVTSEPSLGTTISLIIPQVSIDY